MNPYANEEDATKKMMDKLAQLKDKDFVETTHKIDVKIGDCSGPFKTKLEAKYYINGAEETKHYQHVAKNLHFSDESIGVIVRVHSNNP